MSSGSIKNCWEFFDGVDNDKCNESKRLECPAYKLKIGNDCWIVAGNYCNKSHNGTDCLTCPWFKNRA